MQGKRNEILASCYWWIYSRTRAVKGNWLQRLFGRAVARAFESACRWDLPAAPREKEVASAQGEIYCRGDPRCRGSSQASRDRICPPFVRHAHLRKAGAHLLMGMDCIQPSCRTAVARHGGLSPARPKELLILAVCCRDACCIAKASRGIRGAQHRRIDIWAGDRWIEGPGLSYPLIHPQHFSHNGFCSILLQEPACS